MAATSESMFFVKFSTPRFFLIAMILAKIRGVHKMARKSFWIGGIYQESVKIALPCFFIKAIIDLILDFSLGGNE